MKKVKLAEVSGKKWNISKEDRQHLDNRASASTTTRAIESIAESMMANIEISSKISDLVAAILKTPHFSVAPEPAPASKPVEVIIPVDKTKKKYRFNVVRDKEGLIDYVDVEQR